jgi:hypothetical protein
MVSTPRPKLTPLSSLVAWTSRVLGKSERFRYPRNANSLLGWFCMVVVGRLIGFDVMVCGELDVCALCAQEVEVMDHLRIDCVFSQET